jgi:hypothetical protein
MRRPVRCRIRCARVSHHADKLVDWQPPVDGVTVERRLVAGADGDPLLTEPFVARYLGVQVR